MIQKFDSEENIDITKKLRNIQKNEGVEEVKYYNNEIKQLMIESSDGEFECDEMMIDAHERDASEVRKMAIHIDFFLTNLRWKLIANTVGVKSKFF